MVPMSLSTFGRKPPISSWGAQKLSLPVTDGDMGFHRQQGADYIEAWSRQFLSDITAL